MGKKLSLHKKYKHEGGFVGLPRRVFISPAYRNLSLAARCLLDELQEIYRPQRNGRIALSVERAASRLGVSFKTASNAFYELVEHGFIEHTHDANWMRGQAREWRLTYEIYRGREPTDDWKDWQPKN